jgi:hypothetical protein
MSGLSYFLGNSLSIYTQDALKSDRFWVVTEECDS